MKLSDLHEPFPEDQVHWRAQTLTQKGDKALALAYLDARDVQDRLDAVCGPENWQCEYTETQSGRVICRLGIKIGDEWVWKSDGAGATAVEGEKGGLSDAFKRAAVPWGVGRYLYRMPTPWVPCETYERGGKKYFSKWLDTPWRYVKAKQTPNPVADAVGDAWEQSVTQNLPDDPSAELLADAYADQIEADMAGYKTIRGLDGYKAGHEHHIRFIEEHAPERFGPLRALYLGLRKELSEGKAA